MDTAIKEKVLAVARSGRNAAEWTAYFRVTLGLYYLAGLMTSETIDFKKVDRAYNQFIYHTIGKGHSITSVLQFMSGEKVVPVVSAARFMAAFREHCPDVPGDTIPFLLQLNLGVAKNISGIDAAGPVLDWIERHAPPAAAATDGQAEPGDAAVGGQLSSGGAAADGRASSGDAAADGHASAGDAAADGQGSPSDAAADGQGTAGGAATGDRGAPEVL